MLQAWNLSLELFLAELFCAMETTWNESFEHTVKMVKDKWIMGDTACTVQYILSTLHNKVWKLKQAVTWNKISEKDAKIILLTTALNNQNKKGKDLET